eukprot:5353022-Prymnesium_polylepis.1
MRSAGTAGRAGGYRTCELRRLAALGLATIQNARIGSHGPCVPRFGQKQACRSRLSDRRAPRFAPFARDRRAAGAIFGACAYFSGGMAFQLLDVSTIPRAAA